MKASVLLPLLLAAAVAPSALRAESADKADTRVVGVNGKVYNIPASEAEDFEFLYRSMPLSDQLMYSPEYHLRNIRYSQRARREMPWGKSVPDDIWRHFVLPARSNNEYLDTFRPNYYDELADRVKGLTMEQAALEVNHWLHEKVTYEPSDSRTSAPMATMLNAKGRCGEESVFGVAAFRTVGIPARQVYTPRWAHTDDNHAWVEVWVDGKWHFLGACEPEPELDRAWFNAPASRGLLMHTNVFGDYKGPEQIIAHKGNITEINVTSNYVPTRESTVTVYDMEGRPLEGITVEYKIYNYAEFYTAARMKTDSRGQAMLETGKGDMLAWATDGTYFGFAKVEGPDTYLVLNHRIGDRFSLDIDIVPPAENPIPSHATPAQVEQNQRRFEAENRLREAYMSTFFGEKNCTITPDIVIRQFGPELGQRANHVLAQAKGNWQDIYYFLSQVPRERLPEALDMLGAVSAKDLRDTPTTVLLSTLEYTTPEVDNPLYVEYILNPRISNELLSDYRKTMRRPGQQQNATVQELIDAARQITIDTNNSYNVPITPMEVWKARRSDAHSRDIFFVAACRNNHIPARINPVTGACQYWDGSQWVTVSFDTAKEAKAAVAPEGTLKATYTPSPYLKDPEYYRHFTISAMNSGTPRLMDFGEDIGETYRTILLDGTSLPAGYYLLTTGVRQASGAVSAHLEFFDIEADHTTTVPLEMRHSDTSVEVIGSIDAEARYLPENAASESTILNTTGRDYFILGILGDTDEPSNHAATDLASIAEILNDWGRPIVLIGKHRHNLDSLKNLSWGIDPDGRIRAMLEPILQLPDGSDVRLPIIVMADSFGRVVFITNGYDTSLAQKLTQLLPQL